jgi:NitT/TauT family transport system substrate-binding protein
MTSVQRGAWLGPLASLALAMACTAPAQAPAGAAATGAGTQAPGAAGGAGGTSAPPREAINVAIVTGINTAPYALAVSQGYYTEQGLDVTLLDLPSATGVKAAVAGEVQFVTAAGAAIAAAMNDAPIRVVFISAPPPLFSLYGQPNMSALTDLRGKRVGISSRGSGPEVISRIVFERAGVDPDADITWVAIGAGTARTQALIAGSVEGAVLSSPSDILARRAGFRELSNFAHEFRAGGAAGAATTTDFLQRRPGTAGRWLEASLKGLRYAKANRAGTIQAMAPGLGVDDDVMGEVYDSVIDAFGTSGVEDEAAMATEIDLNKRSLGLDQDVRPEQVFDFTLTREAANRLDQSGWRP